MKAEIGTWLHTTSSTEVRKQQEVFDKQKRGGPVMRITTALAPKKQDKIQVQNQLTNTQGQKNHHYCNKVYIWLYMSAAIDVKIIRWKKDFRNVKGLCKSTKNAFAERRIVGTLQTSKGDASMGAFSAEDSICTVSYRLHNTKRERNPGGASSYIELSAGCNTTRMGGSRPSQLHVCCPLSVNISTSTPE